MKHTFSIIVPSYNSGKYLEQTLNSILVQRHVGTDLELIVVDGGSTDITTEILQQFKAEIDHLIVEPDTGPANAINKGLILATGDILAWLNADDIYYPNALMRAEEVMEKEPKASFCFGKCVIINEQGLEIRQPVTRFKELFFPISSRFTFQCINYISQPAMFFRRNVREKIGLLREDMVAAWDYEFILRLWQDGNGVLVPGERLSAFRWHDQSISGQHFKIQFKEEYDVAVAESGVFSLQNLLHFFTRWGIIGAYSVMSALRNR